MAGKIDELERLNALRRAGTLTSEEYEQEKAKLLSGGNGADYWHRNRNWLTAVSGTIGLAIAVFVIKPIVSGAQTGSSDQRSDSAWAVSQKQDPMTDRTVTTALRTFEGENDNIEVAISCGSDSSLKYETTAFDKEGKAVGIRPDQYRPFGPTFPLEVRIDQREPMTVSSERRFDNQVALGAPALPAVGIADDLSTGSRITFGIHLLNGDETITIDQTDPTLKTLLRPCVTARAPAVAAFNAQMRQAAVDRAQAQKGTSVIHPAADTIK